MKKLFLFLFVFLMGCNLLSPNTTPTVAAITGSDGVAMTLGEIPKTIYTGQGLTIPITLENKGATNVENANLFLAGYNPSVISLDENQRLTNINLNGKTPLVPIGEKTTKIYTASYIALPGNVKESLQTIGVNLCYKYQTKATASVCINPTYVLGAESQRGACTPGVLSLSATQGAPVAVTKIDPIYTPNGADFLITVKDVSGKGQVVDQKIYDALCNSGTNIDEENYDVVNIEVLLGPDKINCIPTSGEQQEQNVFVIQPKEPSVKCTAEFAYGESAFTTPLTIILSYGYVQNQAVSVNVINTNFRG